ncbi:protein of unknown function [Legionella fallonii LLAP-10]|uniref:Uncharacterized protein n=1 Tax=Legionella fallonii LLAP-10 TaxID=1212491 RepID=A0A098G3R0_9GAMM|nr:protein of unknown function [Legionella fallonii LLAP-10]
MCSFLGSLQRSIKFVSFAIALNVNDKINVDAVFKDSVYIDY